MIVKKKYSSNDKSIGYQLKQKQQPYTRLVILFTAITMIIVGLYRGEHQTVLKKAVMICLECIGLG